MSSTTLLNWLIPVLIFGVQATIVYGICRLLYVGGGVQFPNPFQKGWSELHAAYGVTTDIPPLQSTSAQVGMVTYKGLVEIGFGEDAWFLRKTLLGNQTVRIPYADTTVVKPPARHTVLLVPIHTDGLFTVQGIRILLKAADAATLLARSTPHALSAAP